MKTIVKGKKRSVKMGQKFKTFVPFHFTSKPSTTYESTQFIVKMF